MDWITKEAEKIESKIISIRRNLHELAEVGFELKNTYEYVFNALISLGIKPKKCGKSGIVFEIVGEKAKSAFLPYQLSTNLDEIKEKKVTKNEDIPYGNKTVLLRVDMDALPIEERTCLAFKSENGCMHSCGHDMHTAILLGAAEILIKNKEKFTNRIVFLFQAAEETLEGAKDAIDAGILKTYSPDFGATIHVLTDTNLDTGALILSNSEVIAPSADLFEIEIFGKGAHGAMPGKSIDPILIGAHTILALEGIMTRECAGINGTALTIGEFQGGKAPNVIPETVKISGTIRTYDESARSLLKSRIDEVAKRQAEVFLGNANITFKSGCPVFKNDVNLAKSANECLKNAFSSRKSSGEKLQFPGVIFAEQSATHSSLASEDFSYFTHKIPSIMLALAAGNKKDGYIFPLHNPKTAFDERALLFGTIAYASLGVGLK